MKNSSGAFLEFEGKAYSYFGRTSCYEFHRNPEVVDYAAITALESESLFDIVFIDENSYY